MGEHDGRAGPRRPRATPRLRPRLLSADVFLARMFACYPRTLSAGRLRHIDLYSSGKIPYPSVQYHRNEINNENSSEGGGEGEGEGRSVVIAN